MNKLISALQCKWCLSELTGPVILPCGNTICSKHTQELVEEKGKCLICGGSHHLEEGKQFPENKMAIELLEAKINKLNFGPEYEDAVQAVSELETKFKEFSHAVNNPADYLSSYFDVYKLRVDLKREQLMQTIDGMCDEMIDEINKIHNECTNDVNSQSFSAGYGLSHLGMIINAKMNEWKSVLDELVINQTMWRQIKQDAATFVQNIDACLKNFTRTFQCTERAKYNDISSMMNEQLLEHIMNTKGIYSVCIQDLSRLDMTKKSKIVTSKTFMIMNHSFFFETFFAPLEGHNNLCLAVFLYSNSNHEEEVVRIKWRMRVLGKHYDEIVSKKTECEYTKKGGYGFTDVISLSKILRHPGFDWKSDMIRIEVSIRNEDVQQIPIQECINIC